MEYYTGILILIQVFAILFSKEYVTKITPQSFAFEFVIFLPIYGRVLGWW